MIHPKEKAKQLVDKFLTTFQAELVVDEIIESRKNDIRFDDTLLANGSSKYYSSSPMYLTYWKEVKFYISIIKKSKKLTR